MNEYLKAKEYNSNPFIIWIDLSIQDTVRPELNWNHYRALLDLKNEKEADG